MEALRYKSQWLLLVAVLNAPLVLDACSNAKFTGKSQLRSNQPDTPQDPPPVTPTVPDPPATPTVPDPVDIKGPQEPGKPDPEKPIDASVPAPVAAPVPAPAIVVNPPIKIDPPQCQPSEKRTGAQIAFVIDNSNSNAETDCPNAQQTGTFNGSSVYQCKTQTSRESAVLAAFDLLRDVAASEPDNDLAKSRIAVGYFPTKADYVNGWQLQNAFMDAVESSKQSLQDSLLFSRQPYGMTPYLSALSGATEVFKGATQDARSKVMIFVTDGEATDRDPALAVAKAEALMSSGVQLITVYYPTKDSRATRASKHEAMMREIDQTYYKQGGSHWFDEQKYSSFEQYISYIVGSVTSGSSPEPSTLMRISSKVDGNCQDNTTLCARKSYEVADATGLKEALQQIIKTEAIGCSQ